MNKVILLGRLTAKPELRYTPQNRAYTRFSIAVNRTYTNQDGSRTADFFNVVAWERRAENVAKFFDKGSQILIEGRLQTSSYDDKDGNKRNSVDIQLDSFDFVDTKASRTQVSSQSEMPSMSMNEPIPEVNVESDPFAEFGDSVSIDDNFLE